MTFDELPSEQPFAGVTRRSVRTSRMTIASYAFEPGAFFGIYLMDTFWFAEDRIHLGTGGGITWDSTPEGEWAETADEGVPVGLEPLQHVEPVIPHVGSTTSFFIRARARVVRDRTDEARIPSIRPASSAE